MHCRQLWENMAQEIRQEQYQDDACPMCKSHGRLKLPTSSGIFVYVIIVTVVDISQCASNPCVNGGTCEEGLFKYICRCTGRWAGTNCEGMNSNIDYSDKLLTGIK